MKWKYLLAGLVTSGALIGVSGFAWTDKGPPGRYTGGLVVSVKQAKIEARTFRSPETTSSLNKWLGRARGKGKEVLVLRTDGNYAWKFIVSNHALDNAWLNSRDADIRYPRYKDTVSVEEEQGRWRSKRTGSQWLIDLGPEKVRFYDQGTPPSSWLNIVTNVGVEWRRFQCDAQHGLLTGSADRTGAVRFVLHKE